MAWIPAVILGCAEQPGTRSDALIRSPISATLALVDLADQPVHLWQNPEAPATVVVFTRSDCPISNRHAPDVRELYEDFHPRGVEFFLVYVDPDETAENIWQHLEEYDYPCPGLRDPEHALVAATGATVTPEAAVIDRGRQIVYRGRINDLYADFGESRAAATTHELADALEAVISGRQVVRPVTKAVGCYIGDLK